MAKKAEKLPLEQSWSNWSNCIKGNDTNSIFRQITLMIWDTAIFRLVVEGRQIQVEKNPDSPTINGAFHSFIDRNYFQSQVTFIRRLTDKYYGLAGEKGIYSIYALVNNICEYRSELTREMFFKLKNMPYDFSEIRDRERKFISRQPHGKGFFVPSEFDWESIYEAHQIFDRLSGITPINRQPNDVITERVFIKLREKLANCQKITDYVDKFVAHSATPESRAIQNISASEITFKQLWEAQQIIFEVAGFLSLILFSEEHMALAIENSTFFQHWDAPIFEKKESDRLRSIFESYRKETEQWNRHGIENTWQWIES